jgi:two-component system cell cycle response regulator
VNSGVNSEVNLVAAATEFPDIMVDMDSVLVAEDEAVSLALLESQLRKFQFNVITAKDGLLAWDELQKDTCPNLIILDWMMPGLTGIDLVRKIRSRDTVLYPYILLLTSKDAENDLVEGLDAGADDYMIKPVGSSELRARLRVGKRILRLQRELLLKEQQIRHEARHDKLTGLWNRGAILEFVEREIAIGRRRENSVGVLMIDIDRFKSINDTHGHQAGDEVLRLVGERLVRSIRNYDWVGRYGGEEFLVLLCNSNAETIITSAERIRKDIASEPVRFADVEVTVTVSIGTSFCSGNNLLTCKQLVAIADSALYLAKNQGRNRVEIGIENDLACPSV